jgi:hypothetical protein
MTPEEVYVSPNDEVLVIYFTSYLDTPDTDGIFRNYKIIHKYKLEVGRWYKRGLKSQGPNSDDFVYVIHDDKHIPHDPRHFMSKSDWRETQINKVL